MDEKKIILTDLDGTFVMDSHSVNKKDLDAFHELKDNFIMGVATGRSLKEIDYLEEDNGIKFDIGVGFNGSLIRGTNGELLVDKPIQHDDLCKILSYLESNNIIFDALDGLKRIGSYKATDPKRLWGMNLVTLNDPFDTVRDMNIYKINVRPGKEKFDKVFSNMIQLFPGLSIYEGGTQQRIEISAKNSSKGTAVEYLKNKYKRDVIVVGDSGNDAPMFEKADISFCISHAKPEVKNKADYAIDSFADVSEKLNSMYKEMI
ncbi:HAD-IIB family hydrolase [Companilactobacillus jidongensis]|uniref:HAD-IIB family hydrolase n=1 Tax=Companilactobacillus jidongensis TaxID=2486006 RepID=UPI000F7730F5|nr:HAD-IIB family hydrolase [Companilactobacillus jidongensis]